MNPLPSTRAAVAAAAAVVATATTTLVATLVVTPPAHAEDRRPCVSKREFYGARDFGIVLPPGHDWMSKTPAPTDDPIGRLALEERWDVRHRGSTVTHTVDGTEIGPLPQVQVKRYRSCEHRLADLQVYVGFHADTDLVLWTLWWPTRRD